MCDVMPPLMYKLFEDILLTRPRVLYLSCNRGNRPYRFTRVLRGDIFPPLLKPKAGQRRPAPRPSARLPRGLVVFSLLHARRLRSAPEVCLGLALKDSLHSECCALRVSPSRLGPWLGPLASSRSGRSDSLAWVPPSSVCPGPSVMTLCAFRPS